MASLSNQRKSNSSEVTAASTENNWCAQEKSSPQSVRHFPNRSESYLVAPPQRHLPRPYSSSSSRFTAGASEPGILVAVVTGNFLHEHHDPATQGGIINSHERFDQP